MSINKYLSFKVSKTYLRDLRKKMSSLHETSTAPWGKWTRREETRFWKKARVILQIEHLINLYDLSDIWRRRNPDTERFTWRNKSSKIQVRLDVFLISNDLSSDVQSCSIVNAPESDHSTITLHLKSESLLQPKGPSFWKFNNSLLEDCEYVDKLREEVPLFKNKYSDVQNASLKWDLIKMEIRGFTIKFAKIKAKRRRKEEYII